MTTIKPETIVQITKLTGEFVRLQDEIKQATESFDRVREALASLLAESEIKSDLFRVDGVPYKVTMVRPERAIIDHTKLKDELPSATFASICSKVDSSLLEAAIDLGVVSAELAGQAVTIKQGKAYPKVTLTDETDDD